MKFFFEMSEDEIENVNLSEFTGLNVGDQVRHKNAGVSAGSAGIIPDVVGTVEALHNCGLHTWGGLCVVVDVRWADGREDSCTASILKRAI